MFPRVLGAVVVLVGAVAVPAGRASDLPDQVTQWRTSYAERLARLQSVITKYREDTLYSPPSPVVDSLRSEGVGGRPVQVRQGHYIELGEFSFLNGCALYDHSYSPDTVQRLLSERQVFIRREVGAYSAERAESLVEHGEAGQPVGVIMDRAKLPLDHPIDIALGLRRGNEQTWITPATVKDATFRAGTRSHVIMELHDSRSDQIVYRWELDPDIGYAPVVWQALKSSGALISELNCSEFAQHDGIYLPGVVVGKSIFRSKGVESVIRTVRINDIEYAVNPPENLPQRYEIRYPPGTLVTDMRVNLPMRAEKERQFSDRDIYNLAMQRDSRRRDLPRPKSSVLRWMVLVMSGFVIAAVVLFAVATRKNRGRSTTAYAAARIGRP